MKRTKSVLLRLSEEEYGALKELSGREPMSVYLRRVAIAGPIGKQTGRQVVDEMMGTGTKEAWDLVLALKDQLLEAEGEEDHHRDPADLEALRQAWDSPALTEQFKGDPLPPQPSPLAVQAGLVPAFKCPVQPACAFRAASPAARCPDHARLVVPS